MDRSFIPQALRRLAGDERGLASIEFALTVGFIVIAMLNTVDIAKYLHQRMQVENATQMGAQAAYEACDTSVLPATTKCTGLSSAVSTAIQSTSLGTAIQLKSGSPAEGYYCLNGSNELVKVSEVSSKPADCSAVGSASVEPGDYIKVETSYTFKPIFPGISVGGMLPSTITASAMMRMQ